jgi:hypothetical protein
VGFEVSKVLTPSGKPTPHAEEDERVDINLLIMDNIRYENEKRNPRNIDLERSQRS